MEKFWFKSQFVSRRNWFLPSGTWSWITGIRRSSACNLTPPPAAAGSMYWMRPSTCEGRSSGTPRMLSASAGRALPAAGPATLRLDETSLAELEQCSAHVTRARPSPCDLCMEQRVLWVWAGSQGGAGWQEAERVEWVWEKMRNEKEGAPVCSSALHTAARMRPSHGAARQRKPHPGFTRELNVNC